jgi:hypothetical protein
MIEFIKKNYSKLGMGLALSMLVINYFQQRELAKLRAEHKTEVVVGGDIQKAQTIDSLNNELFVQQTIVTRYETALELLKEADKKAADKFELILTTQTE